MIDIVILSCSANDDLKKQTIDCLDSLFLSEDDSINLFNVIVLESEDSVNWNSYPNTKTYKSPEPYGYHKYMNYGRKLGKNEYVCLCNNDLIFYKNWASNILQISKSYPGILSFSPICPRTQPLYGIGLNTGDYIGYEVRKQISGWCIFQKREIYETIGDLDERFTHWFSDNDYALTLYTKGIQHCLVTNSIVEHHDKNVGKTGPAILSDIEMYNMTSGSQNIFTEKWDSYFSKSSK
jgi:GT2 family glycosyltransferase